MYSYYSEMFIESISLINDYPEKSSQVVFQEFELGVEKLGKLNKQSMAVFCLNRFSPLSRKMQEKKLQSH